MSTKNSNFSNSSYSKNNDSSAEQKNDRYNESKMQSSQFKKSFVDELKDLYLAEKQNRMNNRSIKRSN